MSPGVDIDCEGSGATHYFSCACREKRFKQIHTKFCVAMGLLRATTDFLKTVHDFPIIGAKRITKLQVEFLESEIQKIGLENPI